MLDLSDIQGNILRGYRSFDHARFVLFRLGAAAAARQCIADLLPLVTAAQWKQPPEVAVNVGISFAGLGRLNLPPDCLASFPTAFKAGMKARAASIGDVDGSAPEHWEEPWRSDVDLLVMLYGRSPASVARAHAEVVARVGAGAREATPHQEAAVLRLDGSAARYEHFGFRDGISNPRVAGAPKGKGSHRSDATDQPGASRPLAPGEFILGHPDEGDEPGAMPVPHLLGRNGTYLVLRKLEQRVGLFRRFLKEREAQLQQVIPAADATFLAAKMFGRWPDGSPLTLYPRPPNQSDAAGDFSYLDDPEGARCPLGAHVRRANPRDSLGFGGKLVERHRLIRRGIPYGDYLPPGRDDDGKPRGLVFLGFNASIERQFEFIQQNWINYGDTAGQGNDMDPILGSHDGTGRMVIQGDEREGRPPFVCGGLPRFVAMRGGEYFFVPSRTALRLIAQDQVRTS